MSVLKWALVFVLRLPISGLFVQKLLVLDAQTRLPVGKEKPFATSFKKNRQTIRNGKTKCFPSGILFSFKIIGQCMIADKIAKVMGHFYGNPIKKTDIKRACWPV